MSDRIKKELTIVNSGTSMSVNKGCSTVNDQKSNTEVIILLSMTMAAVSTTSLSVSVSVSIYMYFILARQFPII